jgi:PKD repeat protein
MIKISTLRILSVFLFSALSTSIFGQTASYFSSASFMNPGSAVQSAAATMGPSDNSQILVTRANSVAGCNFSFYSALSSGIHFAPSTVTPVSFGTSMALTPSGTGYYTFTPANTTDNYVFKTTGSAPSATMVVFKVSGTISTITGVNQIPLISSVCAGNPVTVNATLDVAFGLDQKAYLWYTTDGFTTKNVVAMTGSGTSYSASIPALAAGTNVSYKVMTSGTTTPLGTDVELFTINSSGSPVNFVVNGSPTITAQPASSTICTNGTATLSVAASGPGTLGYQWQEKSAGVFANITNGGIYTGATTANLLISNVPGTYNNYSYRCVVTGLCGPSATSAPATLTVNPLPSISITPAAPSICPGGSVTLTASGQPTVFSWSPTAGLSNTNTAATAASPSTTTAYTVTGTYNGCSNSASVTVAVNSPNTISSQPSNVTLCGPGNAVYSVIASGTSISYQWQEKVGANSFVNISDSGIYSGTTTNTLTLTNPSVSMSSNQYQCIVSGVCTPNANSTPATLTVYAPISAGTVGSAQSVCYGTVLTFSETTPPSGGSGSYAFQWQYSYDNSSYTNQNGATTKGYTTPPQNNSIYFRRQLSSAGCPTVYSNAIFTIVYGNLAGGTIGNAQTICNNTSPASLNELATATGGPGSYTYQWESSTDNATFTPITGASALNYTPGALTTNTYFRRNVTSGGCGSAFSNVILITVNPNPVVSVSPAAFSLCAGGSMTLTASGASTYAWSPAGSLSSPTTASTTATPATTTIYTVTGTSAAGCTATATSTLTVTPYPTITVTPTNPTVCSGSSTTLSASGADTYTWSPAAGLSSTIIANPVATLTSSAAYTVTGWTNGCSTSASVSVTVNTPPTISVQPGSPTICPGQNVTFNVMASGVGINYQWYEKVGPLSFYPIENGGMYSGANTNTLTITSVPSSKSTNRYKCMVSGGCSPAAVTDTVTLTVYQSVTPGSIGSSQSICYSATPAGLNELTPPGGGDGTYSYQWQSSADSLTYSNIPGATLKAYSPGALTSTIYYRRQVINTCGNAYSAPIKITVNPLLNVSATSTNVSCYGSSSGTANGTITGGISPYTYSWNSKPIQTTANATGLGAGNYALTVTDSKGCSITSPTVTITAPTALTGTVSPIDASCNGGTNGSATANFTGGTAPFTYSWNTNPVQRTMTATNLATGSYTVTTTDSNGCTATASAGISSPPQLSVSASSTNLTCNGANNGTATATASGGKTPYTYSWNTAPAQSASTATGLYAGTFTVSVTDANGCSKTASATVTAPAALTASATATNLNCNGAANAIASATAAGGTAPYTYSWSTKPVQTTTNATGLGAGTYTVTVTDSNACKSTASATVTAPAALTLSITGTSLKCNGDVNATATVSATGGTPPYTYSWNTTPIQTTATATGLGAGNWTVTVKDANICTMTATAPVFAPAALAATATATNLSCNGATNASATATATGGTAPYTYSWSTKPAQTTANATGLGAGSYTVTVTDANACMSTASVTVTSPASILVSANASNVSCYGGSNAYASAAVTGGTAPYSYSWNTAPVQTTANAAGLGTGTYTVKVTDANACTSSASVTITSPAALVVSATSTNITCFGAANGTATASGSGGKSPFTVSWNTAPAQTGKQLSNLNKGSYTVTVIDSNGCSASATTIVTEPAAVTATISASGPTSFCAGNKVVLTASPGSAYLWSNGATSSSIVVSNVSGNYTVKVTDANGCSNTSAPVMITVKPQPTAFFTTNSSTNNLILNAFVTAPSAGIDYYFDFGDNTSSTSNNPSHTYAVAGGYQVTLKAMDSTVVSCQASSSKFVTVGNGGCVTGASFTFSQDTVNNTIAFTDKSTGTVNAWYWDYKNGAFSTLQNPNYSFASPGIHTVCLTVRDTIKNCQDQFCNNSIKTGTASNCQATFNFFTDGISNKIEFSGSAGSNSSKFYWSFGNDDYSSQQNPVYTYPATGFYEVCLHTKDTITGCQSKSCNFVHAGNGDCKAKYNAVPDGANSLKVNFADASVGNPTGWHWDYGDGTVSNTQAGNHIFAKGGYYNVCLTTSSGACQNTYCSIVHVGSGDCKTSFNYFDNPVKKVVEFKDMSWGNPTTWSWQFGDGNNSSSANPTHAYASNGLYTVCLTTLNAAGCMSQSCEDITIGSIGNDCQANFDVFESNNIATFKNTSAGDADTYFWDFGDQSTAVVKSPSHTYSAAGYYFVSLTIYNKVSGCFNTNFKKVTIGTAAPSVACRAKYSYMADSLSKTVTFKDESFGNPISWQWSFSDSTSSTLQNPKHVFKNIGFYEVCLVIKSANGSTNTYCNVVGIGQSGLAADFSYEKQGNLYFKNEAIYPVSFYGSSYGKPSKWKWAFGDANYDSLRINVTHNYANAGSYAACLTISDPVAKLASNHCQVVKVGIILGVSANEANKPDLNVYPNPLMGQGIVSYFIENSALVQLSLYDMQGRKLKTFSNTQQVGAVHQAIDISDLELSQGMYLIQLNVNGKLLVKPVIINK